MEKVQPLKIGVVIGRFQLPRLHKGHKYLINTVIKNSDLTLIMIGNKYINRTEINPYTFEEREEIVHREFASENIRIIELLDHPEDEAWSRLVDKHIDTCISSYGEANVTLFGSRDSFRDHYHGKHPVIILPEEPHVSATHIRKGITSYRPLGNEDFLKGILHGVASNFPKVHPIVDAVVIDHAKDTVLLGKKPHSSQWVLPGGFVDVDDESYELAAKREVLEECGSLELGAPKYIMSKQLDDYRYRSEKDVMTTTVFYFPYVYGNPVAGDDLEEVGWFSVDAIDTLKDVIMPSHFLFVKETLKKINY